MGCRSCEAAKARGLTLIDKAGHFVDAMGKVMVATVSGEQVISKAATVKFRLKKCSNCEFASKNYTFCGLCGCLIKAKVYVATEECPAGKWQAVNKLTEE